LATIDSLVDLVHPTVSGISVLTNDTVWVLFDREIDETTLTGSFFISGPDQDSYGGPANAIWKNYESLGSEGEVLQSPGYGGIVTGTITTQRIQNANLNAYTGKDYTGNGALYRTKAIFTPTKQLVPSTEYQVYVSGDEDLTDSIDTGIKTRTVFDTVQGTNLGTGVATFTGGYTGSATDAYYAKITTSGLIGTAKFEWWKDSDVATVFGPYKAKIGGVVLADGVTLSFTDGTYVLDDSYNVVVKHPTAFGGNLTWPFETGSGSIQTVPTTASTTLTGAPTTTTSTSTSSTFAVSSTVPADLYTNMTLPTADYDVVITFNGTVDAATVLASRVTVETEAVNGDDANITHSGVLAKTLTVGTNTLTITIPSGLLFKNNVVTVTLDDAIADTSGNTLGTDYSFYFTTQYDPLYSSVRKLRLEVGAFISSIPDDTLNLAIFEASLEADALTWNKSTASGDYYEFVRRQFTTCKAAEILLLNAGGASLGLAGKKLGDLSVTYNPRVMQDILNKTLACLGKWLPALQGGGYAVQEPAMFVKGELDPDRPQVGRLWNGDITIDKTPISNSKSIDTANSRRWKHGYYSRWGK
jgi:hypothetical protein